MKTKKYPINTRLFDAYLDRMNFLNEVTHDYPQAISFGPADPDEHHFGVREVLASLQEVAAERGGDSKAERAYYDSLGQYIQDGGIIEGTIANLLANDENIQADPGDIVVCNGAQEGMMIIINTLFESEKDVLLVSDPSYIGFVGYAKIYGLSICPVKRSGDSIDFDHLETTIRHLRKEGKNPKALYEVVDFHNPTGSYMSLEKRHQLLDMAAKYNFLIVEDNPYSYFVFDGDKIPTLKALDKEQGVIYLCSFAKSLFPALRLGFILAPQIVECGNRSMSLASALKRTKRFTTYNTSPLLQAIADSYLKRVNYSLVAVCRKKKKSLHQKRDIMLAALENHFGNTTENSSVQWQKPRGGFFLPLECPFDVTGEVLRECVEDYGVIFCPMSLFCVDERAGQRGIRLSFSNLSQQDTTEGIEKLARFIESKNKGRRKRG